MASAPSSSSSKLNPRSRKRVDVDPSLLQRASNGSSYTKCKKCDKDVHVALIGMHDCRHEKDVELKLDADASDSKELPKTKKAEATPKAVESSKNEGKRKATDEKAGRRKKLKNVKDPNVPKKPPSAFFLFMDDFRKTYKEENPDVRGVAQVGKEGGIKWKSMSDEEKKVYVEKAAERKAEYEKAFAEYQESLKRGGQDAVEDDIKDVSQ